MKNKMFTLIVSAVCLPRPVKFLLYFTGLLSALALAAQTSNTLQYINLGTAPNSGDGDPIRTCFAKANTNFGILAAAIDLFQPQMPIYLAGGWVFDSTAANVAGTVNETVTFAAHQTNIFQLLSSYGSVHIDTNTFAATGTNVWEDIYSLWHTNYIYTLVSFQVTQSNLIDGWLVEQCTNGSAPYFWNLFTNYTTLTNAGELIFTNLINTNLPVRSLRIRGPITFGNATFNVPITAATNTAQFATSSNPTNSFLLATVYTNFNQRSLLVGSVWLTSGVSGNANITLYYTNNGIGYLLPMQAGLGVAVTELKPFCVPLGPNSTFQFVGTFGAGASGNVTNAVLFQN